MNIRRFRAQAMWWIGVPLAVVVAAVAGGSAYYAGAGGDACIKCHEIRPAHAAWQRSAHREIACAECHGSIFSADPAFHRNNLEQLVAHVGGDVPERLLVRHADLMRGLQERCAACHAAEYAAWQAGPHGATFGRIFLDPGHNARRQLSDHCLQCHGMFFPGGMRDLVEPIAHEGPWRLKGEAVEAAHPSIPCSACHEVHREGSLRRERHEATDTPHGGLAFFDRREQMHVAASGLPVPVLWEGERAVRMTTDPRAALCYQCHAPDASHQVFSGDDRTPIGVHEGLSCASCHDTHTQNARASCVRCHPALSNCGLDVATMDTSFRSPESRHNIHRVSCRDCHGERVPVRRAAAISP